MMQRKLIRLLITAACFAGSVVLAATYSTEATMSLDKNEGEVNVDVRVSRLVDQGGKLVEHLVNAPGIKTAPGVPAALYTGPGHTDPGYANEDNVTVDVSWPYPNESGIAFCAVTVKHGDEVVSKSRMQLKIEGPGRVALVVAAHDVDPKSVRVVDEKSTTFVLLEFAGKTREEVKRMASENYGNKVQIRDLQGRLTEGGLSFGTWHETGMALHYKSRAEAEHVAGILKGEDSK
jgi:hypothetical protein